MSEYDIKKAGEKLIWRLKPDEKGNYKPFKPNENDFKALKTILVQLNADLENQRLNNLLFTKLFITNYRQIMRDYDTDVLDTNIKRKIFKELRSPLHVYYEGLNQDIQWYQIDKMLARWQANNKTGVGKEDFLECFNNENQIRVINTMVNEALNLKDITLGELEGRVPFVQDPIYPKLTDAGYDYLTSSKATEEDILKAIRERNMTDEQRKLLLCLKFNHVDNRDRLPLSDKEFDYLTSIKAKKEEVDIALYKKKLTKEQRKRLLVIKYK